MISFLMHTFTNGHKVEPLCKFMGWEQDLEDLAQY